MIGSGVDAKICGLRTKQDVASVVSFGARYAGFVFYDPSPRAIVLDVAKSLLDQLPEYIIPVGVFVDPTDDDLARVKKSLPSLVVQLHGTEEPYRVAQIKSKFNCRVIKAVRVQGSQDLEEALGYERAADMLLFDAKVTDLNSLPGGNAVAFDWNLLAGAYVPLPWILSGGLTVDNVVSAVDITGAKVVDVSSGVEDAPGFKSSHKIEEFLSITKTL
tara:strand:+ start:7095 stop:7745 length:651 start_codon:yes stop_codon:yes gene_type:complete